MGLCTGAAAAAEETSENAAAVAASSASPPAMFIPELGALAYGAGAELAVERLGGDRTQALLRAHAHPITALAHHPSTRRIASASASADAPGETASVFLWDARTGAKTMELRHEKCGGGVVSLAFSPKGDKILSVGADPAGAVVVWDVVTGASLGRASAAAPAAGGAWCRHGSAPEFVVFGAEGAALFRVLDQTPRRGENGENREDDANDDDDGDDDDVGDGDDPDDDLDAGSTAAPKSNGLASAKFSFDASWRDDADVGDGGEIPVCTAGCVSSDGALFLGDSRGRLWRASFRDRLLARVGTVTGTAGRADDRIRSATRARPRFGRDGSGFAAALASSLRRRAPLRRSRHGGGDRAGESRLRRFLAPRARLGGDPRGRVGGDRRARTRRRGGRRAFPDGPRRRRARRLDAECALAHLLRFRGVSNPRRRDDERGNGVVRGRLRRHRARARAGARSGRRRNRRDARGRARRVGDGDGGRRGARVGRGVGDENRRGSRRSRRRTLRRRARRRRRAGRHPPRRRMRRRVPRSDSNRRRGTRTVGVRVANRRASRGRRGGGRGVRADAHRAAASVRRGTRRGAHAARLRRGGWIRRGDVDGSRVRRRLRRDEDVVRGGGGRARRGRSRDGRGGGRGRHPGARRRRARVRRARVRRGRGRVGRRRDVVVRARRRDVRRHVAGSKP